jgi:hypothetical protein
LTLEDAADDAKQNPQDGERNDKKRADAHAEDAEVVSHGTSLMGN